MKRITFLVQLEVFSGYGQYTIGLIRELQRRNWFISIRATQIINRDDAKIPADIQQLVVQCAQPEDELEILLSPPDKVPTPGRRTVYSTMWESTRLPKHSVACLNQCAAVVVPCEWNRENFIASGVKVPVHVCPIGIDPTIFRPTPLLNPKPFVFGCGGRLAHGAMRKGVNDVIAAFVDEFPESDKSVRLKVKVFEDCKVLRTADKRVEILAACIDDDALTRWYSSLHCFVSAAKSEGWGLMQHQAMASGRPIIAAKYGGVAEFFDESCGIALPYKEGSARDFWGQGNWCYPDYNALKAAMRQMTQLDGLALQEMASNAHCKAILFDWKACGDAMERIIASVESR